MLLSWRRLCVSRLLRLASVRRLTVLKLVLAAIIATVVSLLLFTYHVSSPAAHRAPRPVPTAHCSGSTTPAWGRRGAGRGPRGRAGAVRGGRRVLVLVETQFTAHGVAIVELLQAARLPCRVQLAAPRLPDLTRADRGRYAAVVFEKLALYAALDTWSRHLLHLYCRQYAVGIVVFAHDAALGVPAVLPHLRVVAPAALSGLRIAARAAILRTVRPASHAPGPLPPADWTAFVPEHDSYETVASARDDANATVAIVVHDRGRIDGIERVVFGGDFSLWLHRLLFLDALAHLSHATVVTPLHRYVLVDVDDIFVGRQGIRMVPDDVQAMVRSQKRIQKRIPGFRFNLGFSGCYYKKGSAVENEGDEMLLANKAEFIWFSHMCRHEQPHKFINVSSLEASMRRNQLFAKVHGIVLNSSYAVAPHHSGVYPVHDPLYDAWKRVWGVKVTSTEEYPHLRPARARRGFIYRGIKVLPRQTCGLFTHNLRLDEYPGGKEVLDTSIRGGELFQTLITNPVNIYMTHMSNYGTDRLALYTFESLFEFVSCWTTLQLRWLPPLPLSRVYFDLFPEDEDPVWRNPCEDTRLRAIWSENKTCTRLPQFLVIGPQKTGTTALYTFLTMHPAVASNFDSPSTFEEVQFFNGRNYFKGLDWYMSFFPERKPGEPEKVLFEKSANYFDSEDAAYRAYKLLPNAKLICILHNPAKRAYSWYQHMRAHKDAVAVQYSFYDVISADETAPRPLRGLRHRCLNPGAYEQHLEKWLAHYPAAQMLILDGDELRSDPVAVMDKVQTFLQLQPYFDYSSRLKYNPRKGFYCQVVREDHTQCLGRSKGRQYPPMDPHAELFLQSYYRQGNAGLAKLLNRLKQPIPEWLADDLHDTR